MGARTHAAGRSHIIYDDELLTQPGEQLFDAAYWRGCGLVVGQGEGRGDALFLRGGETGNDTWVLRHYRRGGLMAQLLDDRYFTGALEHSRPFREWRLTAQLHTQGLPVPQPVAARVHGSGPLRTYDLITRLIPNTRTLASVLAEKALGAAQWRQLGELLWRFHDAGLLHHDINARNLLVDATGRFFLIDLDKAEIMQKPGGWQERTRLRLLRSLRKFAAREPVFHFSEADWQALTDGYRAA